MVTCTSAFLLILIAENALFRVLPDHRFYETYKEDITLINSAFWPLVALTGVLGAPIVEKLCFRGFFFLH